MLQDDVRRRVATQESTSTVKRYTNPERCDDNDDDIDDEDATAVATIVREVGINTTERQAGNTRSASDLVLKERNVCRFYGLAR